MSLKKNNQETFEQIFLTFFPKTTSFEVTTLAIHVLFVVLKKLVFGVLQNPRWPP
jgi:hypothetical protein